jgi:type II secretory ATPase GspE/PulE/Tfp pilus assembly ATPase PilB-like protein
MAVNWGFTRKSAESARAAQAPVRLGDLLVQKGVIQPDRLRAALVEQQTTGKKLGEIFVKNGDLSDEDLERYLVMQHGNDAPRSSMDDLPPLPGSVADFALQDGAVLYVAQGRVGHPAIQSWLADARRMDIQISVESCDMDTLSRLRGALSGARSNQIAGLSAVRKVRQVVADAVEKGASDISMTLVENGGNGYMDVHYRVKGDLKIVSQFTEKDGAQMMGAMFQGMSKVADATVRDMDDQNAVINDVAFLRGDDGRDLGLTGLRLAKSKLVSGMGVAVRLLYHQKGDGNADLLDKLGYSSRQNAILRRLARLTSGVNLFTGPTGSGKSTTLAAEIRMILKHRQGVKIITIEDPVEYEFRDSRVWQYRIANANTEEEKSRAFAGKLKAALREDPDIIMVGEIRGLETAREAINAAMTGHQVWTTLHVTDPFQILQRLTAMGVEPFLLTDPSLMTAFIGQRLVKTLCPHCSVPLEGNEERFIAEHPGGAQTLENLTTWTKGTPFHDLSGVRLIGGRTLQGVGTLQGEACPHCHGTGISGRTVAAQVIPTDDELLQGLLEHGPSRTRSDYLARPDAEITMQMHGVLKILAGEVDPRSAEEMLDPIRSRPDSLRELTMEDL